MKQVIEVKGEQTLLEALSSHFPTSSRTTLRRMLQASRVRLDGVIVNAAQREVQTGQTITILPRDEAPPIPAKKTAGGRPIEVIFEDKDILILSKPAGLLTIATDKMEDDTLHSRALAHVKRGTVKAWAHIVHRLDKRTSGLLIFARHESAKAKLQTQFAERGVERIYFAVVEGHIKGGGTIQNHLVEDERLRVRVCDPDKPGAREAITHWQAVASGKAHTLVRLDINTGRRHQIRVHMAELGFPLAGDADHGAQTDPLNRLCLHATKLGFDHPTSGKRHIHESEIPKPFLRLAPREL